MISIEHETKTKERFNRNTNSSKLSFLPSCVLLKEKWKVCNLGMEGATALLWVSAELSRCVVLQALRSGVLDVVPLSAFDNLTAEDFRLLLNGCGEVNVQQLTSYTSFNDETGGLLHVYTQSPLFFWYVLKNCIHFLLPPLLLKMKFAVSFFS